MPGILYVIGVGPGDPELLTLKAVRILKQVRCVCVPKGKEEGCSLALAIVNQVLSLDGKEIIEAYFPMRKTNRPEFEGELDTKWQETAETVRHRLNQGLDLAFITLGDPTIYSTFFYLYDKLLELDPGLHIEIIPGISSINAAAAISGLSLGLGDDKIAILPAAYQHDIKDILEHFDTVVLMKVHRVFDIILKILDELNLTDKAAYVVKAGTESEKIFKNINEVKKEDLNYFSMVIVKK